MHPIIRTIRTIVPPVLVGLQALVLASCEPVNPRRAAALDVGGQPCVRLRHTSLYGVHYVTITTPDSSLTHGQQVQATGIARDYYGGSDHAGAGQPGRSRPPTSRRSPRRVSSPAVRPPAPQTVSATPDGHDAQHQRHRHGHGYDASRARRCSMIYDQRQRHAAQDRPVHAGDRCGQGRQRHADRQRPDHLEHVAHHRGGRRRPRSATTGTGHRQGRRHRDGLRQGRHRDASDHDHRHRFRDNPGTAPQHPRAPRALRMAARLPPTLPQAQRDHDVPQHDASGEGAGRRQPADGHQQRAAGRRAPARAGRHLHRPVLSPEQGQQLQWIVIRTDLPDATIGCPARA